MPRLIVFDLDGTLVDSRRDLAESANELIVQLDGTPLDEGTIGNMIGPGVASLLRQALAAGAGIGEVDVDLVTRFRAIYERRLLDHTLPYPGVRSLLQRLTKDRLVSVLTNKPTATALKMLAGLDLLHFFRLAICADGPFPLKPDPSGLQYLMREAEISPADCLMVGDSLVDHQTARDAGSMVCMARYGFGYAGFPEDRLRVGDLLIDSPSELADLL